MNFFKHYVKSVIKTLKEIKESDNKIYSIILNKGIISSVLVLFTIILSIIGEIIINNQGFIESFYASLQLFALNLPSDHLNFLTGIAFLLALLTISLLATVAFFKDFFEQKITDNIMNDNYNIIFGLSEINRNYLNNIQNNKIKRISTLIIEKDPKNKFIEEYKQKGFGILIGNSYDIKYNYKNMQNAIIAFGEDRYNIDFARKIIEEYDDEENDLKLIIHIENKDLEILFHTKFVNKNEKKINIKTFSFYEEVAKDLFSKYSIDGDTMNYIESNKELKSIVIGNGILIEKIIYQMALISHLPNENIHTITIIDKEADKLLLKIKKVLYYKEENFPTLKLESINLDKDNLEFYNSYIWQVNTKESNLVNVIIGYDDEKNNLDTAVELYNKIYLQQAIDKLRMPKILFAIYNELLLSKIIDENKNEFNNFYTFGNVSNILNYNELIDEESDILGKLIHFTYEGFLNKEDKTYSKNKLIKYNEEKYKSSNSEILRKINISWYDNTTYNDKLSSISQSKLIDLKLKSLGLKRILNKNINIETLMKLNRDIFDSHLDEEFDKSYDFPSSFDDTKFKKLIRLEHNRWNAFHYLNGWKYDHGEKEKFENNEKYLRKQKKIHDCLSKIENFNKNSIKNTIIYDIYSFMYIPNYLAEIGYEITTFE